MAGGFTFTLLSKFNNLAGIFGRILDIWGRNLKHMFTFTGACLKMFILLIDLLFIFEPRYLCIFCAEAAQF